MSDSDNSGQSNPTPPVESKQTPSQEQAPAPYGITNVEQQPTDPAKHDETDVAAALERETQDGKGPDPVPETDFDSFATTGVEVDDETDTGVSDDEIVAQVLAGKWGAGEERRRRLAAEGHDPSAIARIVNRRLTAGAATAFPTTVRDDATAVIRGEWGSDEDEIKRNLDHAGKNSKEVWEERNKQLGL